MRTNQLVLPEKDLFDLTTNNLKFKNTTIQSIKKLYSVFKSRDGIKKEDEKKKKNDKEKTKKLILPACLKL